MNSAEHLKCYPADNDYILAGRRMRHLDNVRISKDPTLLQTETYIGVLV